jgi:hypothetical protein
MKVYSATIKISKAAPIKYTDAFGPISSYKRSTIKVTETKTGITASIKANDIIALMASSNYVMKAAKAAESALGAKVPQKKRSA